MEVIHSMLAWNEILTVSILGWLTAQLIKTTISSLLAGKLQLERMVGDGGMPSAHSATVCAMVVATGRIEGVHSTWWPSSPCTTPWASATRPASRPRS